MPRKRLIVPLSCVLAALVLLLTWWFGAAAPTIPRPTDATAPETAGRDTPPPLFEQAGPTLQTGSGLAGRIGNAKGYYIQRRSPSGQVVEFFGDTLDPLPAGEASVGNPMVRAHIASGGTLVIRGQHGRLYAPDNLPQRGLLTGNVTLEYYSNPASRPADFGENSRDLALRLQFDDEVRFDLIAGQIESPGGVVATGRRFDFQGVGFLARYNEQLDRIERLEVQRDGHLKLRTGPLTGTPTTTPSTTASSVAGASLSESPQTTAGAPSTAAEPWYRARFERLRELRRGQLALRGDWLDVMFALSSEGAVGGVLGERETTAAKQALSETQPASAPSEVEESPAELDWAGKMVVEPLDGPPATADGPRDTLAVIEGRPVSLLIQDQPVATAWRVVYHAQRGLVRLVGEEGLPMDLHMAGLGTLTASDMTLDPTTASATIRGPGVLKVLAAPKSPRGADTQTPSPIALDTPSLVVAFADHLDLGFYTAADPTIDRADPSRLRGIRQAAFHGKVSAQHPDFDLQAGSLAIDLSDPADGGSPSPTRIVAKQDVQLRPGSSLAARAAEPWKLDSQALTIDWLTLPGGQSVPCRILAEDHARFAGRDTTISAGQLQADLLPSEGSAAPALLTPAAPQVLAPTAASVRALSPDTPAFASSPDLAITLDLLAPPPPPEVKQPPTAAAAPQAPAAVSPQLVTPELTRLYARHDVVVEAPDGLTFHADRLEADPKAQRLELWGEESKMARVVRPGLSLLGEHVLLSQAASTVRVDGPGEARLDAANATSPTDPLAAGRQLHIFWQKGMTYDDRQGQAKFTGNIRALSESKHDRSSVTADELAVDMVRLPGPRQDRGIRAATASGNTVLTHEQFAEALDGTLKNRLTLRGQTATFDNVLEQLVVPGAGSLLIEDRQSRAASRPSDGGPLGVALTGHGDTLLTWKGKFTLSARRSDMTILDDVQLDHLPGGAEAADSTSGGSPVHLDCSRLLVELQRPNTADTSGGPALPMWFSTSAPQPVLQTILAEKDVRVIAGERTYLADQLQYTGDNQTVMLRDMPGGRRQVEVRQGNVATVTASALRWNLERDQIEIVQPGPTRVPIRSR
ncbi:MAG: hypothetical protein IT442_07750 [Phycisphaeraceae bacterium]|nr:hypothetical protein [Phycisphaeraceae bacterium]